MKDYIEVVYDEKRKPLTDYPARLAAYLGQRFGIQPGAKLLEIGCGRGECLEAFQSAGVDVYGVDLSDYCSKNKKHLKVNCVDLTKDKLPYPDAHFDIVFHKSLLEHFYSPERIMRETSRVLKPGGKIIILTPDWVSQMKNFYDDCTHSRPYTIKSLQDVLELNGFARVRTELFHQYPAIWRHSSLKVLSSLMSVCLSSLSARKLTELTGIKYFRWSVEKMVLGYGEKENG